MRALPRKLRCEAIRLERERRARSRGGGRAGGRGRARGDGRRGERAGSGDCVQRVGHLRAALRIVQDVIRQMWLFRFGDLADLQLPHRHPGMWPVDVGVEVGAYVGFEGLDGLAGG